MKNIKIKYFGEVKESDKIKKVTVGDWIDLRARKDMFIPLNSFSLIPLGVAMELPEGYEALLVPRSSTFKKWGIIQTNSVGVIDESYCGDEDEWMFPAYCIEPRDTFGEVSGVQIHKGDRICQFRIIKHQPSITFEEVEVLENVNRGGFGSTGTN